jgi:hypothetical protein
MGWVGHSRLNEWTHEPLEHRIAQARADAQDEWAEELAMGAGAGVEASLLIPAPDADAGLPRLHVDGVPAPGVGARSHSHTPRKDAA